MEKWISLSTNGAYAYIENIDKISDYWKIYHNVEKVGMDLVNPNNGSILSHLYNGVEVIPNGLYVFHDAKLVFYKEEYERDALEEIKIIIDEMKGQAIKWLQDKIDFVKNKELNCIE